jgi:hypothetical protein
LRKDISFSELINQPYFTYILKTQLVFTCFLCLAFLFSHVFLNSLLGLSWISLCQLPQCILWISDAGIRLLFLFFAVLGFELRTFTSSYSTNPIFVKFFEIGSHKLLAWAGFEPLSFWSLPLEKLGLQAWATGTWQSDHSWQVISLYHSDFWIFHAWNPQSSVVQMIVFLLGLSSFSESLLSGLFLTSYFILSTVWFWKYW